MILFLICASLEELAATAETNRALAGASICLCLIGTVREHRAQRHEHLNMARLTLELSSKLWRRIDNYKDGTKSAQNMEDTIAPHSRCSHLLT